MKETYVLITLIAFIFCSCQPADMTTVLRSDGSCVRILSAKADAPFIAGDTSHNPFPVDIDAGWQVQWTRDHQSGFNSWPQKNFVQQPDDTAAVTAIATRSYRSVEEMADSFRFSKRIAWHKFKTTPLLRKKFRWFYTYYQYAERYPKLPVHLKVPLSTYMTGSESSFWLTGVPNLCEGMNGNEMNDYLSTLGRKSRRWLLHNMWEEQYEILMQHLQHFPGHPTAEQMQKGKDSILQKLILPAEEDIIAFRLGKVLNTYFHTTAFSLLNNEEDPIAKLLNNPPLMAELGNYNNFSLRYKLLMPGTLLSTNGSHKGDTLIWKLDATRLLNDDYTIEAQSRQLNSIPTVLSMLVALACIVFLVIRKNR